MSRVSFLLAISLLTIAHSAAADLPGELIKCRGIDSLASRLQCYDRVVDGGLELGSSSAATVTETAPAVASSPTPLPATTTTPTTSRTAAPAAASQKPKTPMPKSETIDRVEPEELFGKSADEVKQAVSKKLEIGTVSEISSNVVRVQINPSEEYVVYLENGQVWKQTDKAGKWRIKVGETAIISKAALGSYLMKSDARKRSVRAERLR